MTNETGAWKGRHDAAALAARIRKILAGRRGITEKPMFGGVCFLRRSHMLCGAAKQGFMFRVGRAQHAKRQCAAARAPWSCGAGSWKASCGSIRGHATRAA